MQKKTLFLWVWRGLGAAIAVGALEGAAALGETPVSLIPFVTSIAVVLGMPEAEPAQPRALIGGHIISALVGMTLLALFGSSPLVAAAGVGLALVTMRATRTMHPPAGINPLLIVAEHLSPVFILVPIGVGALALSFFAYLWHRTMSDVSWPRRQT